MAGEACRIIILLLSRGQDLASWPLGYSGVMSARASRFKGGAATRASTIDVCQIATCSSDKDVNRISVGGRKLKSAMVTFELSKKTDERSW